MNIRIHFLYGFHKFLNALSYGNTATTTDQLARSNVNSDCLVALISFFFKILVELLIELYESGLGPVKVVIVPLFLEASGSLRVIDVAAPS
jgi:hypothetical protein